MERSGRTRKAQKRLPRPVDDESVINKRCAVVITADATARRRGTNESETVAELMQHDGHEAVLTGDRRSARAKVPVCVGVVETCFDFTRLRTQCRATL